jgi:hypothetical protein
MAEADAYARLHILSEFPWLADQVDGQQPGQLRSMAMPN